MLPPWTPFRGTPALVSLVLCACTAAPPVSDAKVESVAFERETGFLTLGPNDLLVVQVLGHQELSTSVEGARVDPQGMLFLPLVGGIDVNGKSLSELNVELDTAFERFMKDPVVSATILEYASRTFHVLGQVDHPGPKTMDRPLSALEALSHGGRMTPGADRGSIFLLRPHDDTLEVHEFDARTPDALGLVQVRPGDIVFVRTKGTQELQEDLVPILSAFGLNAFLFAAVVD